MFPELLFKNDTFHLLALFLREFLRQFEGKAKGLIQIESIQTRNRTRSGKHPFKFLQTLLESGFEPGLLLGEFVPDLITPLDERRIGAQIRFNVRGSHRCAESASHAQRMPKPDRPADQPANVIALVLVGRQDSVSNEECRGAKVIEHHTERIGVRLVKLGCAIPLAARPLDFQSSPVEQVDPENIGIVDNGRSHTLKTAAEVDVGFRQRLESLFRLLVLHENVVADFKKTSAVAVDVTRLVLECGPLM